MKNSKISGLLIKTDEKHRGYSFTKECFENALKEYNSHHNTKEFDLRHDTSPVDLKLSTDGVYVNVTLLDSNNNDIINIIK
jgi:hypothetical protein